MPSSNLKTPVVLIIFKRPHTTLKVFEAIRKAKPKKLFLIADGPRIDNPDEVEKCKAARAIVEQVDWDCEVLKNYSDTNLGCARKVSSGLDWVFSQTDEAIILEDDCLPHPTFFPFCEELLEKYRHDERIASISGQNVQFGRKRTDYSYYLSRFNHCWGWATWKRAWQCYDFEMKLWAEFKKGNFLQDILIQPQAVEYWTHKLQFTYEGKITTVWDYQWMFSCWTQNRLSILSNTNLISNIGFGEEATNTKKKEDQYANLPTEAILFPLKHPQFMIQDVQADMFTQSTLFKQTLLGRYKMRMKNLFKKMLSKVHVK